MKPLPIVWQRLVSSDGRTCDRCSDTHEELLRAVSKLKAALEPLGIEPTLEVRELGQALFDVNPSESNRVWIAGQPMEAWLGAETGSSRCCSVCGESECRTMKVGDSEFEAVPEYLFLKAALLAASGLLTPD
ncbi:MAG: DUF2703 domain-containing protein [Chloroflexi bacterium]|nr:DUF2703 domain-containing protein [Chloroflexota bacterium]